MNKMHRILASLAVVSLPLFPAQITVPTSATATEQSAELLGPFNNLDRTFQLLFASSQLATVPVGSQITALGFRVNGGQPDRPGIDVSYNEWNVQLSRSLNGPGSLSATFADNIAPGVVTVRSGALTIPAGAVTGGAGANPFYFIPFTTPYIYTGDDLLVTIGQDAAGGGPLFSVDAVELASIPGVADTVLGAFGATTGTAQFFNLPVTALEFTPVPEPSFLWPVAGAGVLLVGAKLRRARPGKNFPLS